MNNSSPLVSIICLCYNHEAYVTEAIRSVLDQTYTAIELIVVDDASSDNSVVVIEKALAEEVQVKFLPLKKNLGNCAAFNAGWRMASGKYIIDLAADDVLLPQRVETGVAALESKGQEYGVHYCDADIIDQNGKRLRIHRSNEYFNGTAPEGFIFDKLLRKYFINPVTMMFSAVLLDKLGGYDESLAYEDFDFWVRSSKDFKYCYSAEVLVVKRILKGSHSKKQYSIGSEILISTYRVCLKAYELCETKEDIEALKIRISYELKRALFSLNWKTALDLYSLKTKLVKQKATLLS